MQISFNSTGTRVILIGNTRCDLDAAHLPALPTVENNVRALDRIFRSADIMGLHDDSIEMIIDPPSASHLLKRMAKFAQQATDTLLVYYAGHGIKSSSVDGLFLATVETTEEHCHLDGVEFHKVRQVIFKSPAAKKILIFDCCYSGEITSDEMGGDVDTVVAANIKISGTYSIASAPRNKKAYAPSEATYTAFSGEMINVLEGGIKDKSDFLTLNRIYDEVRSRIALNPKLPRPQRKTESDEGEFVFAKNAYWSAEKDTMIRQMERQYKTIIDRLGAEKDEKNIEIRRLIAEMAELRVNKQNEIGRLIAESEKRLLNKDKEIRHVVAKGEELRTKLDLTVAEIQRLSAVHVGVNGNANVEENDNERESFRRESNHSKCIVVAIVCRVLRAPLGASLTHTLCLLIVNARLWRRLR